MSAQPAADTASILNALFDGILAKSTRDPAFRKRLKDEPTAVLTEMGLTIPATISVAVEDSVSGQPATPCRDDHLVLTLPPEGAALLTESDLDKVAGGGPLSGFGFAVLLPMRLLQSICDFSDTRSVADKAASLSEEVKDSWADNRSW